ncbi:MAG: TolC family protein [Bacteroidota bacterium]
MRYLIFLVCCCCIQLLSAQTTTNQKNLSLEEAITIALTNNHQIKIQRQSMLLANNNITKANAGMLPTVDAVGMGSYTNNFAALDLRTFQPEPPIINVEESGVETTTINLGVEANYLLWDGGQRRLRYQLLEGLSEIEKAKQSVIINGIIEGITELYFEIVKLQNQAGLIRENMAVVRERIAKIEDRKEFGKANQLDILQAQTTLNQDISTLDNLNLVRANLLLDLQRLMNDESTDDYVLANESSAASIPNLVEVNTAIQNNNPQLVLMNKGIDLADLDYQLAQKATRPTIASFANAGYFWQQNDVQQLAKIQTLGGTVGLSVRYNLFDGGIRQTKIQNAQITKDLEQLKKEELVDDLYNQAEKEVARMRLIQAQLERETTNLATYEANYQKVAERFKLGQLPEITLREAQLALTNSKLTSANLKVDFEKAAMRLRQLTGDFVK